MGKNFLSKTIHKNGGIYTAKFFASSKLPQDIPITTPFTFPKDRKKYLLILDKDHNWNPLGGHLEAGESWVEALKRECLEEGGVEIGKIQIFGYMKITTVLQSDKKKYPLTSVLPFTSSEIYEFHFDWKKFETKQRKLVVKHQAYRLLSKRNDSGQMLEIFSYMIKQQ